MEPLRVHSACAGKRQKNPSLPTFSWAVLEKLSVVQRPHSSFSTPSPGSVGSTCWQPSVSLSFQQELRLSGDKRERGPQACHLHCPPVCLRLC